MASLSDVAAERAVLAGVCAYGGDAYADIADIVTSRTFTLDSNQTIWACLEYICKDSHQATVDYPSLLSAAHSLGLSKALEKNEEKQHLRAVMNMPVQRENVLRLAGKVRKLEIARLLDQQLDLARDSLYETDGTEPIDRILSRVESPIFDFTTLLAGTESQSTRRMGDGAKAYLQHLMDNPREMVGISTGLPRYDKSIGGGLRPNSLDVIAARVKTGKTMCVDHVALHVAGKLGIPVLNLDTEMAWEEHLHRVAANLAGLPITDIERGVCGVRPINRDKVLAAADLLEAMPYHYRCILAESFEETLAHMRRWVLREVGLQENGKAKPCVVLYDYLKMMSADSLTKSDLTEWQMLGFIATALKNFAGRYGVAILAFAQLNREGDIAASDRIKWFCTSYAKYAWKDEEEKALEPVGGVRYTHTLSTELSRHGEGLKDGEYINIRANYRIARIEEGPTRYELEKGGDTLSRQKQGIVVDDTSGQPEVPFVA